MHGERIEAVRAARAARVAGLYAITPELPDTDSLVRKVSAAIEGGAGIVQYRDKSDDRASRARVASLIARVCRRRGALLIVNDDACLAVEVDADGVHVGEEDARITEARRCVGPERLVGASCYNDFERAQRAVAAGADYVAFGSFFGSATKPTARRADAALLRRARSLGVPVVAIGGITASNASLVIEEGADAVAVIADVFGHADEDDVTRAAQAISALFARTSVARRR